MSVMQLGQTRVQGPRYRCRNLAVTFRHQAAVHDGSQSHCFFLERHLRVSVSASERSTAASCPLDVIPSFPSFPRSLPQRGNPAMASPELEAFAKAISRVLGWAYFLCWVCSTMPTL
jgi:hypothetical protein